MTLNSVINTSTGYSIGGIICMITDHISITSWSWCCCSWSTLVDTFFDTSWHHWHHHQTPLLTLHPNHLWQCPVHTGDTSHIMAQLKCWIKSWSIIIECHHFASLLTPSYLVCFLMLYLWLNMDICPQFQSQYGVFSVQYATMPVNLLLLTKCHQLSWYALSRNSWWHRFITIGFSAIKLSH